MSQPRLMDEGLVASIYTFVSWFSRWAHGPYSPNRWGPLLEQRFGCFAFSIAVQQLYASRTSEVWNDQFVYFWSSLYSVRFGIGTVLACLPSIVQIG